MYVLNSRKPMAFRALKQEERLRRRETSSMTSLASIFSRRVVIRSSSSALANPDQPNPFHKGLTLLLPGLKSNLVLRDLLLKEGEFQEVLKIPSLVYEEPQELSREEMGLLNNQVTQFSHIIGEEIAALQVLSLAQALCFPQEVHVDEEGMETSSTTFNEIKHQTEMVEDEEASATSTSYLTLPGIAQQHPYDLLAIGEQAKEIIENDVYACWHTFKIEDILFFLEETSELKLIPFSEFNEMVLLLKKVTLHVFTHENVLI